MYALITDFSVANPLTPASGYTNGNATFQVESQPNAYCQLHRAAVAGDMVERKSGIFQVNSGGTFQALWGKSWPAAVSDEQVTVWLVCGPTSTLASGTATSPTYYYNWPPVLAPTPSPS